MIKYKAHFATGLLLIALGSFISSSTVIQFLRISPGALQTELLIGATLFRTGLIALGIVVILLGRIPIWSSNISKNESFSKNHNKTAFVLLVTILVAAFGLRLYRLNDGIWLDEILTYVNYARAPFGEIVTTYDSQNQHFLYSILAHTSLILFGEGVWPIRLPAVLFGVGSIWALYLFGRRVACPREAILSAALLGFSYHHIWFSQNARGYTGLLFFTILSSWLLVQGLSEYRPHLWLVYAILAALGAYTHVTMIFVITGHFVIYAIILFARQNKLCQKRWLPLIGFFLAGFLTLQLYTLVLPQMFGSTIGEGSIVTTWRNPFWALVEFLRGVEIGFKGIAPAVFAIGIFSVGIWNFAQENPIVIGLLLIPAMIVLTVAIAMGHHIWPRLFFFTVGFGILVIARGTTQLGRLLVKWLRLKSERSSQLSTALFIVIILVSAVSVPAAYGPKQDYLAALRFVETNKSPGDVVVTVGSATFVYQDYYQSGYEAVEDIKELNLIRKKAKTVWIIYTFPFYLKAAYPEIMAVIQGDFRVVRKFNGTLNGGTIYICRSSVF